MNKVFTPLKQEDADAFLEEKRSERLPLAYNDLVKIKEGDHVGELGWIVGLVESEPEARYTVDYVPGKETFIFDSLRSNSINHEIGAEPGAKANTRDWGRSVFPTSLAACGSALTFGNPMIEIIISGSIDDEKVATLLDQIDEGHARILEYTASHDRLTIELRRHEFSPFCLNFVMCERIEIPVSWTVRKPSIQVEKGVFVYRDDSAKVVCQEISLFERNS